MPSNILHFFINALMDKQTSIPFEKTGNIDVN